MRAWRLALARRAGCTSLLQPGADRVVGRQSQAVEDLQGLLPGPGGGGQVTGGPAGIAEAGQQAGQLPAVQRGLPVAREVQGLPVAADSLGCSPSRECNRPWALHALAATMGSPVSGASSSACRA